MSLNPEVAKFLKEYETLNLPDFPDLKPQEARDFWQKVYLMQAAPPPLPLEIENGIMAGVPVRTYTPKGKGPFPCLVFFHGGGFVVGTLDQSDRQCQIYAHRLQCVVVSVDYRLAPEHPFPAAPEDAYAVTCEVIKEARELNCDPNRIGVAGVSAGGTLAAAVPLMLRDRKGPKLKCQVIIYPVFDVNFDTPSYKKYAEGYLLTRRAMIWFMHLYLPSLKEAKNPYACPLHAKDFSHLPPACIALAECDPLHDEGMYYADCLRKGGVEVHLRSYRGLVHGFCTQTDTITASRDAVDDMLDIVEKLLK